MMYDPERCPQDCPRKKVARGWCHKCYQRVWMLGKAKGMTLDAAFADAKTLLALPDGRGGARWGRAKATERPCEICSKPTLTPWKGLCGNCGNWIWKRQKINGDPRSWDELAEELARLRTDKLATECRLCKDPLTPSKSRKLRRKMRDRCNNCYAKVVCRMKQGLTESEAEANLKKKLASRTIPDNATRPLGILPKPVILCSVPGCGREHQARGVCKNHYMQAHNRARNGDRTIEHWIAALIRGEQIKRKVGRPPADVPGRKLRDVARPSGMLSRRMKAMKRQLEEQEAFMWASAGR